MFSMNNNKVCPYRTKTIIYHNNRKNYMIPNIGINKLIDYDVADVTFKSCLEEECMFFDKEMQSCNLTKIKSTD